MIFPSKSRSTITSPPSGSTAITRQRGDDSGASAPSLTSSGRTPTRSCSPLCAATASRRASSGALSESASARSRRLPFSASRPDRDEVHRRHADDRRDERVDGAVVDVVGRARPAARGRSSQHADPVGHAHRLDLVVGDVDERAAELALQVLQLGAHLQPQQRVERRERLVEEIDARRADEARPIATRWRSPPERLAGLAVEEGRRSAGPRRSRSRAGRSPASCTFSFALAQREGEVVVDRLVRVEREVLEDDRDVALARHEVRDVARRRSAPGRPRGARGRRSCAAASSSRRPGGPSTQKNSPSAMSRSMPSSAVTSPNRFVTPLICRSGSSDAAPFHVASANTWTRRGSSSSPTASPIRGRTVGGTTTRSTCRSLVRWTMSARPSASTRVTVAAQPGRGGAGSTSSMCSGRMPIVNAASPSSALRGWTVIGRAPSSGIVSTSRRPCGRASSAGSSSSWSRRTRPRSGWPAGCRPRRACRTAAGDRGP